jgi:large subunit ribosomal protein L18
MSKADARRHRHIRLRKKLSGTPERPRLFVRRSLHHIYADLIDDAKGHTLATVSTLDKSLGDRRQSEGSRHLRSRLRSRRLQIPWPRARTCGRGP